MALSYDDSAKLSADFAFRGRVKMACLHFAQYIAAESPATPAHNTRFRWAQSVYQSADSIAGQIQSAVVMEPQVQQDGDKVTDPDLQIATETAIQNFL